MPRTSTRTHPAQAHAPCTSKRGQHLRILLAGLMLTMPLFAAPLPSPPSRLNQIGTGRLDGNAISASRAAYDMDGNGMLDDSERLLMKYEDDRWSPSFSRGVPHLVHPVGVTAGTILGSVLPTAVAASVPNAKYLHRTAHVFAAKCLRRKTSIS